MVGRLQKFIDHLLLLNVSLSFLFLIILKRKKRKKKKKKVSFSSFSYKRKEEEAICDDDNRFSQVFSGDYYGGDRQIVVCVHRRIVSALNKDSVGQPLCVVAPPLNVNTRNNQMDQGILSSQGFLFSRSPIAPPPPPSTKPKREEKVFSPF